MRPVTVPQMVTISCSLVLTLAQCS